MTSKPTNSADKPPMLCGPCNLEFPGIKEIKAHFKTEHPVETAYDSSADVDTAIDEAFKTTNGAGAHACYCPRSIDTGCECAIKDEFVTEVKQQIKALLSDQVKAARIEGMEKAKSRVLRRTEIPADAKNPTRDATVYLGEAIADIIQSDINELKALSPTNDKELEV